MSDKISVQQFPSSELEAIALLYVQNQDLSGKTPTEMINLYYEAYYEILGDYARKRNAKWFSEKRSEALKD